MSHENMAEEDTGQDSKPMTRPPGLLRRCNSFAHGDVLKYRNSFDALDFDKEGYIKASDIGSVAHNLGYRISKEQIKELLVENELSEDSKISFDKFLELVPRNESIISEDEHQLADLREKFQRYDMDQNGEISLQEAQWALQMELRVKPVTALRLLNQFIRLNYDQFTEFFKQLQEKKLEIYQKFGRYDTDQDGFIDLEEAHKVLHSELGFSRERSKAMVNAFDVNRDDRVSYVEFAEFYMAVEEKKKTVRQAFQYFDKDKKGYVSYEAAEEILTGMLGYSAEKAMSTIKTFDKNLDEKIDYEEFMEFFSMLEEERKHLSEKSKPIEQKVGKSE